MTSTELDTLRFPVGHYTAPPQISADALTSWIAEIAAFPSQVREAVAPLSDAQKAWRYRPAGWSILQVVHHCADSHMNSINRFKLALTQDNPTIAPYPEHLYAELHDSLEADLSGVLCLLDGLHYKWVLLLKSLSAEQLKRTYFHPDDNKNVPLEEAIGVYAWHCRHHLAHIRQAVRNEGKFENREGWSPVPQPAGVTGIGGVFFKMKDPEAARHWFALHLGLSTDAYGSTFETRNSDNPAQKGFLQWSPMKDDTTYFDPSPSEFMINYKVRGLDDLLAKLKASGVTIIDQVATYDYGRFVHILGPEQQSIELWEPVEEVYDALIEVRTK